MNTGLERFDENSAYALMESWAKAEQDGEQYPVPFDLAWQLVGYSKKANAKRTLMALDATTDFCSQKSKSNGGRDSEVFRMTCEAFKHFCLMAKTELGRNVRQYFIECEKKWRMVQEVAPSVAEEVEALKLKRDILKLENDLFDKRHYVVTALPEALQQKVLGYTEVKVVEYRDRILKDDEVLRDGSTIQKTEMCQRLGLMTKAGKPDFKRLNHFLENVALPSEAFELKATIRENLELKREYWPQVQEYWAIAERQRWLGE